MAEQTGHIKLFIFSAFSSSIDLMSHIISNKNCIEAAHSYCSNNKSDNKLLVLKNSITDNSIYSVLNLSIKKSTLFFSISNNDVIFSLHTLQVLKIWFCSIKNYNIHT